MATNSELHEKVAIVTGGGRGIGRALALAFADAGARVVVSDLGTAKSGEGADPDVAATVVAEIVGKGQQAVAHTEDLAAAGGAKRLVQLARDTYGQVDVGVYCAGFWRDGTLLRMRDEDFDDVVDVHLRGAFRFTRELGNVLVRDRRGGAILLTSGPAGLLGNPRQANLAAALGGVAALAKTAAQELARHGVRVNALAPTARTRLTEALPLFQSIRPDSLTAAHVAPVAVFLASDAAADVTGEVVGVAGGRVYCFRASETTGLFSEGPPAEPSAIHQGWRSVLRG